MNPNVRLSVGWLLDISVGWLVGLSYFFKMKPWLLNATHSIKKSGSSLKLNIYRYDEQ